MYLEINDGYIITDSISAGNRRFSLGVHMDTGNRYMTWERHGTAFTDGHPFVDRFLAEKDLIKRAMAVIRSIDRKQNELRHQATELTQEEVHALLDSGEETGEYSPRGYFYTKEGDTFVAIDNSTGDAWTEEFQSLKECTDWLFGLGEWGLNEPNLEDGPTQER